MIKYDQIQIYYHLISVKVPETKKGNTTGDLREKSLAMYKSINNMLTHIKKPETTSFSRIPIEEAKGFCLDHAFRCIQNLGPMTIQETCEVHKCVMSILNAGLEEFYAPAITPIASPSSPSSPRFDRSSPVNSPITPHEVEGRLSSTCNFFSHTKNFFLRKIVFKYREIKTAHYYEFSTVDYKKGKFWREKD
jgi:hypothetical protein